MTPKELLLAKGFTLDEADAIEEWVYRGKPGLVNTGAEAMGALYLQGYSCQELQRTFPEFELGHLLWLRSEHDWDGLRQRYRQGISEQLLATAMATRAESIRFVTSVMAATHKKLETEVLDYLSNPKKKSPPELLPASIKEYAILLDILKEAMAPLVPPDRRLPGQSTPSVPLVNLNINTVSDQTSTVSVGQNTAKEALVLEMKAKQKAKEVTTILRKGAEPAKPEGPKD